MKEIKMSYTVLHIDSSPLGDHSVSRKLTAKVLAELKTNHPDTKVVTRDLGISPLPHLSGLTIGAFFTPPEQRNEVLNEALKLSDEVINELFAADVIVIGAPMWNFGIPSSLKAWIDHIVRAGVTFRYTENGPEGLIKGKKVYIAMASGGVYSEGPASSYDFNGPYLKHVLGFLGMTDLKIFRAEGLKIPGLQEHALDKAIESISL